MVSDLKHGNDQLGTYRALIIGINDYKDSRIPDLKTAINDAQALGSLLNKRYGFKVEMLLGEKATKRGIDHALRGLASSTSEEDSVLIYYAGHGDLDRQYNDGWWIPVDAKGGDSITYLDNTMVQKAVRNMKARHVLLISDSCYSGTLFGQSRAIPPVINEKYYLNLYNEKSRWGMTSGNKEPVADDGAAGHSIFAYQLIRTLEKNERPYVSTQEIYARIAPIIGNNSEQTPMCRPIRNSGDQGGEFIFVANLPSAAEPAPAAIKPPAANVTLPPSSSGLADFDAVIEKRRVAQQKWANWQKKMDADFVRAEQYDGDSMLTGPEKVTVWNNFLSSYGTNNPHVQQDETLRARAQERKKYWQEQKVAMSRPPTPSQFTSSTHGNVPKDIELKSGRGRKPAQFPHARHQKKFRCDICHHTQTAYGKKGPYVAGQEAKCGSCHNSGMSNKKLNNLKDIAHTYCKKCHKAKGASTKCRSCHQRKK